MKKLLFFAVSAILAGASYCSSVSDKIVAKITNSDTQIEQQQEQTLAYHTGGTDDAHFILFIHFQHLSFQKSQFA